MNIFGLLSYINKVSLFAFFITILVVGYQIYVLKKEKTEEKTPTIPDFKEAGKSNEVLNYTRLSSSLTKKDNRPVNYSKLVFLSIFLLTAIVIIFVLILIKKSDTSLPSQTLPTPKAVVSFLPTPTLESTTTALLSPSPTINPSPSPTLVAETSVEATPTSSPAPTEIILATLSVTPTTNATTSGEIIANKPETLPETGSVQKGLLIIGVSILAIFFSFWF